MGHGNAAGLLGVIEEVTLGKHIRIVADNLNGVLVGANGAVGAQAPKLTRGGACRGSVRVLGHRQGQVGHIVFNGQSELRLGLGRNHIVVHSDNMRRHGVLRS